MRVRLAFAAITVTALSLVSCQPSSPERPSVCESATMVPPYSVTYEDGSSVGVPSGVDQLSEGHGDLSRGQVCALIVGQWDQDRKSSGYREGE